MRIPLLVSMIALVMHINAQTMQKTDSQIINSQLLNVKIGSDVLVEEAIKGAIVTVESSYFIQNAETGQKYGRNGQSYFNIVQFLGCRTINGIITTQNVIEPWSVDKSFDKYRSDSLYRPVLNSGLIVNSYDIESKSYNAETDLKFNSDSSLVCIYNDDVKKSESLTITDGENTIANWIIWVKNAENNDSTEKARLEYTIVKKNIDLSRGEATIETPNSAYNYLGAIYVSAKVLNVGLVEFSLSGLVVENAGKWIIKSLNDNSFGKISEPQNEVVVPQVEEDDDLTPLEETPRDKKKTKQKKNK